MTVPAPAVATPELLPYVYSVGSAFSAFTKFNGKNYFTWRRNMETQPIGKLFAQGWESQLSRSGFTQKRKSSLPNADER